MTNTRPTFNRAELDPKNHWILEEIEDINSDALDAVCGECQAKLSWAQWLNSSQGSRCHRCDSLILVGYSETISKELIASVKDPDYFDREWFHASKRKNWSRSTRDAEQGNLLVHAGSRLAALSRADDIFRENSGLTGEYYLHSFRLRSSASFSHSMLEDMEDDWQTDLRYPQEMLICSVKGEAATDDHLELSKKGIRGAAYYNRYDVPGDISIIFHAKLIQLNTVETVKLTR